MLERRWGLGNSIAHIYRINAASLPVSRIEVKYPNNTLLLCMDDREERDGFSLTQQY